MPRDYELTYFKPRKCWRKRYKRKTFYLGRGGVYKTDDMSYRSALKEWEAVKRFEDGEGPNPYVDSGYFNLEEYLLRYAQFIERRKYSQLNIVRNQQDLSAMKNAVGMATNYMLAQHLILPPEAERLKNSSCSISDLIEEFLKQRKSKVEAGRLSPKQYAQDKGKLADFLGFAMNRHKEKLSEIDASLLTNYRNAQETLCSLDSGNELRISPETARKRLQTVNKFWDWAYENEYIQTKPRVLGKAFASIKISRPTPTFWSVEEARLLFNQASRRTKLYIALACNCGYTQREIATLDWEMIQGNGTVTRCRPKTGQRQTHQLWDVSLKLLQTESKTRKGLCLLGANGRSLLVESVKADGNITHNDSIRLAFERTMKKAKLNGTGRTFKNFRKTSANAIAANYGNSSEFVKLFLAHSNHEMSRHYIIEHYGKFFEALKWLETHYDFKL